MLYPGTIRILKNSRVIQDRAGIEPASLGLQDQYSTN